MSFVFDQIDAIEKERASKDEALQRIRAWRESKKKKNEVERTESGSDSAVDSTSHDSNLDLEVKKGESLLSKEVELVHPWPEWIELMERLVQQNYFDHRRKDEDKMVENLGFDMSEVTEEAFDFTRDWKTVQAACLNFGRDRFDILRSLSRQDIQILVGHGCPSVEKKVVFSAKLLRKHVHLDEGDVCSSCSLRSSCERGYLLTNKEDEARTIDVMRVLLTYGFDPVNGSVTNKSLLKIKSVKTVIRKLLHEVVKLSSVPIDPSLPPPVIKKPPPKVKQPPPPPKRRVGRDDVEMKKGDWLCPKCDFMNFAKNTVCLQCDAKRPKRQLLPGEWECPGCNFLNYRRNMSCFHCEHKRPPDEFLENQIQDRQQGPRTKLEKVATSRQDVSNAWNFDFDDNESDGADVAAFEFADPLGTGEGNPTSGINNEAQGRNFRGPEDERIIRDYEREHSNADPRKPGIGFNDFDDEEDDIDSYEIDSQNINPMNKASTKDLSEVGEFSENSDDDNVLGHGTKGYPSYNKPSKPIRKRQAFSSSDDNEVDFDSDNELPVHPNWKSSHVADSRQMRGRQILFSEDEDSRVISDTDDDMDEDFGSRGKRGSNSKRNSGRRISESDDDDFQNRKSKMKGNKAGPIRRGNSFKSREDFDFNRTGKRKSSMDDDFDRSSRGYRGNNRQFSGAEYGGQRMNDRGSDLRNGGRQREGSRQRAERSSGFNNKFAIDRDSAHERPRNFGRVIER